MRKIFFTSVVIAVFISFSCVDKSPQETQSVNTRYATFFDVDELDGFPLLKLKDPWNSDFFYKKYLLVPHIVNVPDSIPSDIQVIRTPVRSVVTLSGSHIAFLDKINETDRITGVGAFHMIKNQKVKDRIDSDLVKEVGANGQFKREKLIALNPEIVFVSPFKDQSNEAIERFNIPVIPLADYLEKDPLGRAEWVRFMSFFFHKQTTADSIFNDIAEKYTELKQLTANIQNKPTVFSGKPYGGVWYQSGGKSYMATMFRDAGADFIWKTDASTGSIALDFETVYALAATADYWRLIVNDPEGYSYQKLMAEDSRYEDFQAFRNQHIFHCNVAYSALFEQAPLEPHIVLADLVKVFHPQMMQSHQSTYYYKLPE